MTTLKQIKELLQFAGITIVATHTFGAGGSAGHHLETSHGHMLVYLNGSFRYILSDAYSDREQCFRGNSYMVCAIIHLLGKKQ